MSTIDHIINGSLYECYAIFCSFVLMSFINHIMSLLRGQPVTDETQPHVQSQQELIHMVLQDQIDRAKEQLSSDPKLDILNNDTLNHKAMATLYTIRELKVIARQQKLKGYSNMTKDELVANLVLR